MRCRAPVDLGDRIGVLPQGGRAAAAVTKAGGGVAEVEAAGEELAGGIVPSALDVELHSGRVCRLSDLVRGPVRVPRPDVGRGRWRSVAHRWPAVYKKYGPVHRAR